LRIIKQLFINLQKRKKVTFDIKTPDRSGAILSNEISKYMVRKVYLRIPIVDLLDLLDKVLGLCNKWFII
jgi:hypothetical protein